MRHHTTHYDGCECRTEHLAKLERVLEAAVRTRQLQSLLASGNIPTSEVGRTEIKCQELEELLDDAIAEAKQ